MYGNDKNNTEGSWLLSFILAIVFTAGLWLAWQILKIIIKYLGVFLSWLLNEFAVFIKKTFPNK